MKNEIESIQLDILPYGEVVVTVRVGGECYKPIKVNILDCSSHWTKKIKSNAPDIKKCDHCKYCTYNGCAIGAFFVLMGSVSVRRDRLHKTPCSLFDDEKANKKTRKQVFKLFNKVAD